MFLDSKIGFLLLLTHFLSALMVGILFRFYPFSLSFKKTSSKKDDFFTKKNKSSFFENGNTKKGFKLSELGGIMGDGIRNSISTLLLICGFLVFFCVFGTILDKTGITLWLSQLLAKRFSLFWFPYGMGRRSCNRKHKGIL